MTDNLSLSHRCTSVSFSKYYTTNPSGLIERRVEGQNFRRTRKRRCNRHKQTTWHRLKFETNKRLERRPISNLSFNIHQLSAMVMRRSKGFVEMKKEETFITTKAVNHQMYLLNERIATAEPHFAMGVK